MPAPPKNQFANLQRIVGRELIVLLGPEDGSSPTAADEAPYLRVLEIAHYSGARSLNYCRLLYDLGMTGESIQDLRTPTQWKRQIEVRIADSKGKPEGGLLFWGQITRQSLSLVRDEQAIITATVQAYHFGNASESGLILNVPEWNVITDDVTPINYSSIEFNPFYDGRPVGNQSVNVHPETGARTFLNPDRVKTIAATTYNNGSAGAGLWQFRQVIEAICQQANSDEEWIKNPDADVVSNDQLIRNLRLPRGRRLPEYLDAILEPLGYAWCLDYGLMEPPPPEEEEEDPESEPAIRPREITIRIYSREDGPQKSLYLQKKGATYDRALTNMDGATGASLDWDIAQLANEIIVEAALPERQVAVPLVRAWNPAYDDFTSDQLDKNDPSSEYYSGGENAYRLWAANEAGDYLGLRESITAPLNLDTVFGAGNWITRRRKMEDAFSTDGAEMRAKPLLQWRESSEAGWQNVPPEWGYVVLEDQIGIRFTGHVPPEEVFGEDVELRLVGVLVGDVRQTFTASSLEDSPNGERVTLHVSLEDKVKDSSIVTSGTLAGNVDGFPGPPLTADIVITTQEDLEQYARQMVRREKSAALTGSYPLFGLHYQYKIGDLLTQIQGRNISLNRNAEQATERAFVQIVGIQYFPQEQRTQLITAPTIILDPQI